MTHAARNAINYALKIRRVPATARISKWKVASTSQPYSRAGRTCSQSKSWQTPTWPFLQREFLSNSFFRSPLYKTSWRHKDADALLALVLADSKTGYVECVPGSSKAEVAVPTEEIRVFYNFFLIQSSSIWMWQWAFNPAYPTSGGTCCICSYQCDNWYVSNWRLACHINFCWGSVFTSLLWSLHVLRWHGTKNEAPSEENPGTP